MKHVIKVYEVQGGYQWRCTCGARSVVMPRPTEVGQTSVWQDAEDHAWTYRGTVEGELRRLAQS